MALYCAINDCPTTLITPIWFPLEKVFVFFDLSCAGLNDNVLGKIAFRHEATV